MSTLAKRTCLVAAASMLIAAPAASQDNAHHHHQPAPGAVAAPDRHGHPVGPRTQAQIDAVARAVARYRDFAVAEREGWHRFGGDEPLMGEHWYPPKDLGWQEYTGPDARLDFARPSNLMYTRIGGKRVLTGVAFVVRLGDGEPVPEGFAGAADKWHVHDFVRAVEAATQERPMLRWLANWWLDANYRDKGDNRGRLAMVHVWAALPNPDGPFADHNRLLPYMKLGLPTAHAHGGSVDAARGLDLATADGCDNAAGGKLWIADVSARQKRTIMWACEAATKEVAAALRDHREHPAMLNRAAETAWRGFDAVWERELTAAQQARVAAISEHGANHSEGGHAHH